MFYSQFILAKKGPLGTIWIAAHLERKLRKNQVSDTDIGVSVDSILFPEMPIALRLSSHLLLGVVRIYSKKVSYLFDDCSEALLKVKQAFRATDVDLPPEESTAPYNSITIPETFDLEDFDLPDNENFQGSYVDHHVGAKEQITLEDTMDGVIYSTAEFGQDERFGDGDASGLDLNAEILVEKAATAGNACDTLNSNVDPQASFEAGTPVKHNEYQDDLSDDGADQIEYSDDSDDGDVEPIEYAQASCTPGLLEEPNVPNNQETSTCDDHQEHGNHNTTESENENLKNASCNVQNNQDNQETSTCDDHQQEKSMPVMEHVSMDEIIKTTPFYPIGMGISVDDHGHDGTKDTLNQNAMDKELGVQFTNNNSENWVKVQGNECHLTTQWESNAETLGEDENNVHPVQLMHIPCLDSLETSQREKPSNGSEYSALVQDGKDEINAYPVQVTDIPSLDSLETSQREKPSNVSGNSVLVEGFGSHANNTLDLNLQEIYNSQQPVHSQDQVAYNVPNQQSFYTSVPAAEQLLSVPPESSPFQEDIVRGNEGYYGNDMITRKKRSITEMLKAQSLNHVQSSGFLNTKTTSTSVSNDDLLSSILVGRSSVMEAKPTPPHQLPSKRRRQSAPKTVVSKRKVPMDDCTVLHGDLIREQLINTGDIRRPRRKVPCTWLEISMIEKRFREDEVFNETLFTGASIKLASLHNRSYNISRIKVFQKKEDPPALKPISHLEIENENKENLAEGNQACENNTRNQDNDGSQEQMNTREENELFMQKTADAVAHIKSDEKMDVMFVADMDINSKNVESKNVEIIEAKDEVVVDIQKDIGTLDQETEEVGKIEEETLQPNKLVPEICSEDKQISGDPNTQVDGDELEYSALVNNTDFLKYDEEEEEDEDDDDSTDTEAKRSIDNTEWSSRTKAVSKYLQVMFDKEEEHGRMSLRMNSLLSGKTRKEASRMFFETLVLKTKDYIYVEQSDPFANIDILPTSKLLKSVF